MLRKYYDCIGRRTTSSGEVSDQRSAGPGSAPIPRMACIMSRSRARVGKLEKLRAASWKLQAGSCELEAGS